MKKFIGIWTIAAAVILASCATTGGATQKAANLALGAEITANGNTQYFYVENAVDGDILTYYEGQVASYPNVVTVKLDRTFNLGEMKLKLNPRRLWQDRYQTFEIQTSSDGTDFETAVPSAKYFFSSEENENAVSVQIGKKAQYVRIVFTENTEATAGQIAELEIYPAQ